MGTVDLEKINQFNNHSERFSNLCDSFCDNKSNIQFGQDKKNQFYLVLNTSFKMLKL